MAEWREVMAAVHATLAARWRLGGEEDRRFLALALCGEAGEVANLIKKSWRGDFAGDAAGETAFHQALAGELADVLICLELLAGAYGVDLEAACQAKVPDLLRRWPDATRGPQSG